jgi:hypothetical protein
MRGFAENRCIVRRSRSADSCGLAQLYHGRDMPGKIFLYKCRHDNVIDLRFQRGGIGRFCVAVDDGSVGSKAGFGTSMRG